MIQEVIPGMTVWDLVCGRDWDGRDVNQIGRQPPLSSNKAATHFPLLKKATGIRYDRMVRVLLFCVALSG
jgi:magnesium-dependent phosphatase 1